MSLIHINKRKRFHKNLEPYPHPIKWKRHLDKLIYVAGFLGPILTFPQIYIIFATKSSEGISLISWFSYLLSSIVFFFYAVVHKTKPLILIYGFWILVHIIMVLGIIIYS
jgi:uncharacterized protein with PQ loop repeat